MWDSFFYSRSFPAVFSAEECRYLIAASRSLEAHTSVLMMGGGEGVCRNSDIYWMDLEKYPWAKSKLIRTIESYNAEMRFEIDLNLRMAQLTEYRPGQFYEWHLDLGAGPMSLRKISLVVELQPAGEGGGLEVLGQPVHLRIGDVLVFPSWVMHRALPVVSGTRWSLVQWFLGPLPFR